MIDLPSPYSQYIHISRYARFRDDLGRRETWEETVERYFSFFKSKFPKIDIPWEMLQSSVLNLEVMPSMRALMTAGQALDRDNIAGYNCSYTIIDNMRSFDEIMYILMNGTGVGFSVESRYVNLLPTLPESLHDTDTIIMFSDSKLGWAKGFREFLSLLWSGLIPKWDVSKIRPSGARLKTFGGRASGPQPLIDLMQFCIKIFRGALRRKLTSLECNDIVCKIADIVVCGGTRRSALISLSDLNDDYMREAKSGRWYDENVQRALANNSAVYEAKPPLSIFMDEFVALYKSRSGERGIFSRKATQIQAAKYGRRSPDVEYGTNPCSEIILVPQSFCNLTEAILRPKDTLQSMINKVEVATILGTLQATLTDFKYISKRWKTNAEEERLLGVSLTGICDVPFMHKVSDGLARTLGSLREHCVKINKEYAKKLGITPAAAITCVKPSGTVSQLVNSASGIHPRYAQYYIRRVRESKNNPLVSFMNDNGYVGEMEDSGKNYVFSFPQAAPKGCLTTADFTALKQLELWKCYQDNWCEHKPSITVYVGDDEWMDVGAWVYRNLDSISGISFLPRDNGIYKQAPYEEITKEQYEEMITDLPTTTDWSKFKEETDNTIASQELACTAGACEI